MDSIVNHENGNNKPLHVVMIPWLAMGHMYPYFELAKILAQKGHTVTFINSPKNIDQMPKAPKAIQPFINLVKSPLPYIEQLHGEESTLKVPLDKNGHLKLAYDGFQDHVTEILKTSKPDWVFYDHAGDWVPSIAKSLNISCAHFNVVPSWNICFANPPKDQINNDRYSPPKWVPFKTNIHFKPYEMRRTISLFKNVSGGKTASFNFDKVYSSCDLILIRATRELEGQWLDYISDRYKVPVVPVGILPPSMQIRDNEEEENDPDWVKIKAWLDSKESSSVVYIGFGSELKLNQQDLTELAHGIEQSRLPFFWALKNLKEGTLELPEGFEERTKEYGIVWKTWAPQLKILAHGSIGGCMSHCGSGSVIEKLHFGHVLVTLPYLIDQCLFSRELEERKLAIEVPRNEQDGSFTRDSIAKTLRLAIVDEEGSIYRKNAKDMGKIFGSKDLHNEYIKGFIDALQKHRVHSNN
ncbi:putative soyasaponin III rhamnosyltransferase [Medicago truncatula]|uniref:Putative soyasaponin III rhamnosyltransferase n=1 Tax=Medicago truncatula TaxID=3880 RepID=A0A072VHW6_MEDTR|nr:soyasaponin III rhamnosyltransferase [Medicago truncatula]KEH37740.1 UDP-glucosyltransferase family protein [Medicago truncatula]RHN73833.1 putative soyasaponin III rhamnosyltransferase [Medicago truncatula]